MGVGFSFFSCLDNRGNTWDAGGYYVSLKYEDAS